MAPVTFPRKELAKTSYTGDGRDSLSYFAVACIPAEAAYRCRVRSEKPIGTLQPQWRNSSLIMVFVLREELAFACNGLVSQLLLLVRRRGRLHTSVLVSYGAALLLSTPLR